MLAGGIVRGGAGGEDMISAYVAVSAGRQTRLFRVGGTGAAAKVTELEAATTVDIRRFQTEIERDLAGALASSRATGACGAAASIERPDDTWVIGFVRRHLEMTEGQTYD